MYLKIQCPCGARYSFDVEPVDGQMPAPVTCPKCGADGTAYANGLIQQELASAASAAPSIAVPPEIPAVTVPKVGISVRKTHESAPAAPSAPQAPAAAPEPAAPAAPAPRPGLKVGRSHAHTAPAAAPAPAPETTEAEPAAVHAPVKPAVAPKPVEKEPSFSMGVLGAVVGAILGGAIWYAIIHFSGIKRLGILAMLVGFLSGVGARLLGRQVNTNLGIAAGVATLLAIFATQFMLAKGRLDATTDQLKLPSYEERLAEAKEAVEAAKTDAGIKAFLDKQNRKLFTEEDIKDDPELLEVTSEDIKLFKDFQLQEFKDFVDGKPSRAEYEKDLAEFNKVVEENIFSKIFLIISTLGLFNIIWICASVSTAYRTGCG